MSRRNPVQTRTSFVLLSVLVITASALLVATGLIFAVQTQAMSGAVAADGTQLRALAWSGLQAVMSRLNEQRDVMLAGKMPELDAQFEIYQAASRMGIVRLIAFDNAGRQRLVAESAKLDLNAVDSESLMKTGILDAAAAQAIVNYRDSNKRPFQSATELLAVPDAGITPEKLYGPIDQIQLLDDARRRALELNERVGARLGTVQENAIFDIVGVHNVEPALQQNGNRQINLNQPWSEDLAKGIEERFGSESAQLIKHIFDDGETFETEAKIIKALREFKVPPERWAPILDAFTTEDGEYHLGRVNINTASAETLMALPGISAEQAAQMISVREELSAQERATVAWPASSQIVAPEAYDKLIGKITTRAFTFRVRLAAGEVDAEESEGRILNPVMYEAVIDLAGPKPRVAYLRDISQWQATLEIASQQPSTFDIAVDADFTSTEADSSGASATAATNADREETPATGSEVVRSPGSGAGPSLEKQRIGRWTAGASK